MKNLYNYTVLNLIYIIYNLYLTYIILLTNFCRYITYFYLEHSIALILQIDEIAFYPDFV